MKKRNPNPLNKKNQNGKRNPLFKKAKEFTPNGFRWPELDELDEEE